MEISAVNLVSAGTAATPPPDSTRAAQQREVLQAVKTINASEMFGKESELTFLFDRETRQSVMRVIDRETREVIYQFPSEVALQLAKELKELSS